MTFQGSLAEQALRFQSPLVAKLASVYSEFPQQHKYGALALFVGAWHLFGGKVIIRNKKVVHFLPSFVYELVQNAFFLVNWAIDGLCYLQPGRSEWNEPHLKDVSVEALRQTGQDLSEIKTAILNKKDTSYNEVDLVRLYDSLPAVDTHEILIDRSWDGKILRTNRSVLDLAEWFIIRPLSLFGIAWGKRYRTQHTGDPLLFNWVKFVYLPIPLWGNVCVTDIKWRGVSTGTMNYDSQNWKDYFRILEHDPAKKRLVLLGVWTARSKAGGWFTLTWDPSTPAN